MRTEKNVYSQIGNGVRHIPVDNKKYFVRKQPKSRNRNDKNALRRIYGISLDELVGRDFIPNGQATKQQ